METAPQNALQPDYLAGQIVGRVLRNWPPSQTK